MRLEELGISSLEELDAYLSVIYPEAWCVVRLFLGIPSFEDQSWWDIQQRKETL